MASDFLGAVGQVGRLLVGGKGGFVGKAAVGVGVSVSVEASSLPCFA